MHFQNDETADPSDPTAFNQLQEARIGQEERASRKVMQRLMRRIRERQAEGGIGAETTVESVSTSARMQTPV